MPKIPVETATTTATEQPSDQPSMETMSWRRAGHDSSAVPHRPFTMLFRQPQDGADPSVIDPPAPARRIAGPAVQGEPLDARLTGGTRSLMRRVLGLNVAVPTARRAVRASIVARPQVA